MLVLPIPPPRLFLHAVLGAGRTAGFATNKRVIIMDEVDGMSSGDFGGNAELIALIKRTTTPVICVCNDRQKDSVRSLAECVGSVHACRVGWESNGVGGMKGGDFVR